MSSIESGFDLVLSLGKIRSELDEQLVADRV
jgi:hypothetical protein